MYKVTHKHLQHTYALKVFKAASAEGKEIIPGDSMIEEMTRQIIDNEHTDTPELKKLPV